MSGRRDPVPGRGCIPPEAPGQRGRELLVLTNNPQYTQKDLAYRLNGVGLELAPQSIFTSAMATVSFLKSQKGKARYS